MTGDGKEVHGHIRLYVDLGHLNGPCLESARLEENKTGFDK